MTIWTFAFGVILLLVGLIAYLWYLAAQGDSMAMAALSIFGVTLIFLAFKGTDILSDWLRDRAEQHRFQGNMKENLDLMHAAFKSQNQAILANARTARLNPGQQTVDLPADMFSSVEEEL